MVWNVFSCHKNRKGVRATTKKLTRETNMLYVISCKALTVTAHRTTATATQTERRRRNINDTKPKAAQQQQQYLRQRQEWKT
jgi:hypothetical protein